jgi:hypothetical protein
MKSCRRSLIVAPLRNGPPPITRRTGLPQVWPSMHEKTWLPGGTRPVSLMAC